MSFPSRTSTLRPRDVGPWSQLKAPTSDITADGWLPNVGSSLFAVVSELQASKVDYAYSPSNPTTQKMELKFAPATDPVSSSGYAFDYILKAKGLDTVFDFNLVQNTTVLDSWSETVTAAEGFVLRSHNFSSAVTDSITDHADVRFRLVARA